jgi:flagellar basal body-associated protein FliL
MIVGERKASGFVLLLIITLLVGGFIAVVWFYRKETPTPMRKPPMHSASLLPDKPNRAVYVCRPLAVQLLEEEQK